jgi:hypothetical protein
VDSLIEPGQPELTFSVNYGQNYSGGKLQGNPGPITGWRVRVLTGTYAGSDGSGVGQRLKSQWAYQTSTFSSTGRRRRRIDPLGSERD